MSASESHRKTDFMALAKTEGVSEVLPVAPGNEITDISEQGATENCGKAVDEMKTSDDKFRVMIDTIPALVWCTLPDGSNEFHNQRWHDYTGLSEGEEHG